MSYEGLNDVIALIAEKLSRRIRGATAAEVSKLAMP